MINTVNMAIYNWLVYRYVMIMMMSENTFSFRTCAYILCHAILLPPKFKVSSFSFPSNPSKLLTQLSQNFHFSTNVCSVCRVIKVNAKEKSGELDSRLVLCVSTYESSVWD